MNMGKTKTKADGSRSDAGQHRTSMIWFDPDDLVIIGLDTKDGEEHTLYDPRINDPITDQQIANIRTYGVIQPITVQRDGDRFIVVDGRGRVRRARAAADLQRKAGEEVLKVPCVVKRGSDVMMLGVSRAANSCRTDDNPLRNARWANKMAEAGMSQTEVAIGFGVSQSTVSMWISLVELSSRVQTAVERGQVSATAAARLSKLSRSEQDAQLGKLLVDGGGKATVERVNNAARASRGEAPLITPKGRVAQATSILTRLSAEIESSDHESLLGVIDDLSRAITDGPLSALSISSP